MALLSTPKAAAHQVPFRVLAGIGAVVALALAGALDYYQFLSAYAGSADQFQVAAEQPRFSGAAAALPPAGVVGYLSDVPLSDNQGLAWFGAARYALAPRMLVPLEHAGKPVWVVGNFIHSADTARVAAEHGLSVAADYGNGVVLFRKDARP
jgi:hypothetical protein